MTTRSAPIGAEEGVTSSDPDDAAESSPTIVARRLGRLEVVTGAAGLALAVLVGSNGSPSWQVARVVALLGLTAVLIAMQVRASARWRGRIATLAGMPACAVAAGFTPYLREHGHVVVRLATIALIVAGLSLLIGGAAVATRGRRRRWRVANGAAVFVATAVVLFVAGPAVAATNVPRPEIGATPTSVGLTYETVWLPTADDIVLAGWYVRGTNRAAVILLHGAGSTRSNVLDHAAVLTHAGFGVLMIDAGGHGESEGQAMDFGWHGDADIAAATDYLSTRSDVDRDRIGVVGLSMGGEEAIGASRSNEMIGTVVAEGATARGS